MAGILTMLNAVSAVMQSVPNVGAIFIDDPTQVDPSQYPYILISDVSQREERHGYGGGLNQGRKWVYHTIVMDVHDQTPNVEGVQLDFYNFIDSIRDAMRTNQALGGVALRFGESINVQHGEPAANVMQIMFNATITSEALEEIIG